MSLNACISSKSLILKTGNETDLKFFQMCHLDGLTDKFLNIKLANNSLKHLRTYNNVTQ